MSGNLNIPKVELFGISISNVNMKEALDAIDKTLSEAGKHIVTTPNVDHIVRLQRDREFLEVYRKASLVFADGLPVVWASRVCGKPLRERVAGSDLVVPLCELAAKKGYRLTFWVGNQEWLKRRRRN
jgi:N-acetylglucosaminyldiphosphoundecaprenol N-acetyl-beta-D-mannosaminyltransferase